MNLSGEHRVLAPREAVWAAINDAAVLRAAIPGCEELEKVTDTRYDAVVQVKVGPLKIRFRGTVHLEDIEAPERCRIVGEGQGGVAGFAKGGAAVELAAEGDSTVIRYTVDAAIGGKLAQIGSRIVKGVAVLMAVRFFENLGAHFSEQEIDALVAE